LIGGGDFEDIGNGFFNVLKHYGLRADMDVLEAGCGQGRMARPLVGFLSGEYHGFDIDKSGIDWCASEYADMPNFHFTHADVLNARYNASGKVAAEDFIFPYPDDRFDRVFLTSVFTHMFKADIERYLSEIRRILKADGRVLISWYLWEDGLQSPKMDFKFPVDDVSYTTLQQNPEAAIAFDMDWVKAAYNRHGLEIETIERGAWTGHLDATSPMGLQDLIVAKRKA